MHANVVRRPEGASDLFLKKCQLDTEAIRIETVGGDRAAR